MGLFRLEDFVAAGGQRLAWKVECDALDHEDWRTLAHLIASRCPSFSEVIGVPTGGIRLAMALMPYVEPDGVGPRLVVDDVLTTGGSMLEAMTRPDDIGWVAFARGDLPPRISAVWKLFA